MNVASVDLCGELYGLSGWSYTDKSYDYWQYKWRIIDFSIPRYFNDGLIILPAYDLGYLLRKLYEVRNGLVLYHRHSDMKWECFYAGKSFDYDNEIDLDLNDHYATVADTPEDAAAKLAIKLFEQGVLKNNMELGEGR